MMNDAPCKGCIERHTACHGSCEKYKAWKDECQAKQKYLEENKYRFAILPSESRDRRRWSSEPGYNGRRCKYE